MSIKTKSDNTMGKFNTTTVMLLDEDIQLKMQNARALMVEDIENALKSAEDNSIELKDPPFLDDLGADDVCKGVELFEDNLYFYFKFCSRIVGDMNYEQLHTVYEALKYEGYFNDTEN